MNKNLEYICGCKVTQECTAESQHGISYCPMHAAAADLLKACKAARISLCADEYYQEFKPLIHTLEAAIGLTRPPKPSDPGWFA